MSQEITDDPREVQTSAGAYVEGEVHSRGGDFTGRDRITVGDVAGSVVANGTGTQALVT